MWKRVKALSGLSKVILGAVIAGWVGTMAVVTASPATQTKVDDPKPASAQVSEQKEPKVETKVITEAQSVPFAKTTVNDASMNKGATSVKATGVDGIKTLTYEITTTDGIQTNKKLVSEAITTTPVTEVTAIGTKVTVAPAPSVSSNCDPSYSPCVPNVAYDLDCPDIGFTVRVIGSDHHRLDRDNDGYGCE